MSNLTRILPNGTMVGNVTLLDNHELCTLQTCDLSLAHFTYLPSVGGNALFAAIFGLLFVAQLGLGIRYRTWGYMIAMLCGLVLEAIGYVGRILMHNSPFGKNDFLIYLICLTIAPAFLTAAIYLCLARIVTVYSAEISRIKPRTYTLIFCGCDLFSLVLQGLGGGIAATANTASSINTGKNIMIVGLAFQVASLLLFAGFCADFGWRLSRTQGSWNTQHLGLVYSRLFKAFLVGLWIAVVTIFIRSVFRCIELSGGFKGDLFASDQVTFMVLEGAMISIATITLTILHPAICFQGTWHEADFTFWTKKNKGAEKSAVSVVTTDDEPQRQGTKDAHEMQMMGRV